MKTGFQPSTSTTTKSSPWIYYGNLCALTAYSIRTNLNLSMLGQDEVETPKVALTILTEGISKGTDGNNSFLQQEEQEYGANHLWLAAFLYFLKPVTFIAPVILIAIIGNIVALSLRVLVYYIRYLGIILPVVFPLKGRIPSYCTSTLHWSTFARMLIGGVGRKGTCTSYYTEEQQTTYYYKPIKGVVNFIQQKKQPTDTIAIQRFYSYTPLNTVNIQQHIISLLPQILRELFLIKE